MLSFLFPAVSADKGLFHQAFEFEKEIFIVWKRRDEDRKRAGTLRAADVGKDLIADYRCLLRPDAEMSAGGKHGAGRRLPAFVGRKYAELFVEALDPLPSVV